jgi:hypothetical protein
MDQISIKTTTLNVVLTGGLIELVAIAKISKASTYYRGKKD